jgi:hypothetical protein
MHWPPFMQWKSVLLPQNTTGTLQVEPVQLAVEG